jgi:hypothetical protein
MILFPEGCLLFALAFALGATQGSALIVGYAIALAAGSTAMTGLPALGGATPLIFTSFCALIVLRALIDRRARGDVASLLRSDPTASIALALVFVAVTGAYVLPRLYADQAITFVAAEGRINETPLAPTPGNVTQPAYLALAVATALALAPRLRRPGGEALFTRAFLAWTCAHVALGALDLLGKSLGFGDVLKDFRTASYALLTETGEAGFWRIVGGFPEASGYANYALPCLAFVYVHWREGGGRGALALWLAQLVLLALSTSSTAYAGLAMIVLVEGARLASRAAFAGLNRRDVATLAGALVAILGVLALAIWAPHAFDPMTQLLERTVFNKGDSDSAQERMRWNAVSWASTFETYGMGIGMGSSRTSSWAIAAASQLGFVGAALEAALVVRLFRARVAPGAGAAPARLLAAAKAAAFAWLASIAISGSSADPGPPFFLCLAVAMGVSAPFEPRREPRRAAAAA